MSPYTIPDVVNMIKFAGAEPVFADCVKDSTNLDLDQLANILDETVCAVVVTHYHINQDMDAIRDVCTPKDVMLIDDCALALGATEDAGRYGCNVRRECLQFFWFQAP